MPAYSFQPQFVDPIRAGTKGGTIRAERKIPAKWSSFARDRRPGGHAIAGEELALYCRQRHRGGFLITEKTCVAVEPIRLDFGGAGRVELRTSGIVLRTCDELDLFARFDGFAAFDQMGHFWAEKHDTDRFHGWHIRWMPLPEWQAILNAFMHEDEAAA